MSRDDAPIFKIKRKQFRSLCSVEGMENYIKYRQPLVKDVYCTSIYFHDSSNYIGLSFVSISKDIDDIFLRAINAACNTNIQFKD